MGWLDAIITGSFGTAQQGAQMAFDANQAELNRNFQSDEAEKNRVFQSGEAALQRDWSSQEAERARDWNEDMYEKYNSLSGKVAQAEAAGVNPMFAVTGNAVSPMSTNASAPTGASAGSVGTPTGDSATMKFVDIIGQIMGVKKAKAEIENINANTEKTSEETDWMGKLNQAELENRLMNKDLIESQIHVNDETAGKLSAEALKLQKEGVRISKITDSEVKKAEADALISEFQSSVYRIASDPDSASTGDYIQMGVYLLEKIIGIGVSLSPRGIVHMN